MSWNSIHPRERTGDPRIAALLTWFVPGAGHLYLGATLKAVIGFAVVQGLYLLGMRLSDGMLFF